MRRVRTLLPVLAITAVVGAACVPTKPTPPDPGPSSSIGPITFEPPSYALGSVRTQDTPPWTGTNCSPGATDEAVVDNSTITAAPGLFQTQSLRMSNAVTGGCFTDLFTPQLEHEAGESDAENGGMSGGTRRPFFSALLSFSSVTGAHQEDLRIELSPDRGDGARMSSVRILDMPGGFQINFFDYQAGLTTGECEGPEFVETTIASGLSHTLPHSIGIAMTFVEGIANDVVQVFVDGALVHTGTSWEDFFRECQPPGSRTVDSLLIRALPDPAPDTAGEGLLFDFVTLSSGPIP